MAEVLFWSICIAFQQIPTHETSKLSQNVNIFLKVYSQVKPLNIDTDVFP